MERNKQQLIDENKKLNKRIDELERIKALFQAEYNLFTTVWDTTDALVAMLNPDCVVVRYNRAFSLLLENGKNIAGKSFWELLPPNIEHDLKQSLMQELHEHHVIPNFETTLFEPSGNTRIIGWTNQVYTDEDDSVAYVIITGTDITERKQFERLLQKEQALLHSLVNSITDLIFFKDINGVFLGCNQAFEVFSGHTAEEISRKTDFDLYPPDLAQNFRDVDNQVIIQKKVVSYENKIEKKNGEQIILETRKSPLYGPGGELLGVIGVSRDVTILKEKEEALLKANSEIAQLIASLSSILIVLSGELQIIHWNPSAEKILRFLSKDVFGKRIDEIGIIWDWAEVNRNIELCRVKNCPIYMDPLRFERFGNSEGFLGINISPLLNNAGQVAGFILLCGDITDRKNMETQLSQAQKLKSIGQLAAGIAHEINTPIQYIGDNIHFIQTSFLSLIRLLMLYDGAYKGTEAGVTPPLSFAEIEKIQKDVDLQFLQEEVPLAIQQSLDGISRVTEIVRALKDFSHPGIVKKVPMDINKAIEITLTVARNEWKYVADVVLHLDENLPHVVCLPGEINQVLLNIVVNAAQAIAEKVHKEAGAKGELTITTRQEDQWVVIRIRDTGPGIPENIRSRIFEPFFTTKDVGKGTGQGLAMAYNAIVGNHQGKMSFETQSGVGTTFIIHLPIIPINSSDDGDS